MGWDALCFGVISAAPIPIHRGRQNLFLSTDPGATASKRETNAKDCCPIHLLVLGQRALLLWPQVTPTSPQEIYNGFDDCLLP